MKIYRCKKLNGRKCPRTCHVLNGRKENCPDMFTTDEEPDPNDIPLFEVPKPSIALLREPKITAKTIRRLERKYKINTNQRLPRKLKKATRHMQLDLLDWAMADALNRRISTDADKDVTLQMRADWYYRTKDGYRETRWTRKARLLVRRLMRDSVRRAADEMIEAAKRQAIYGIPVFDPQKQYLIQPGMLTYTDDPKDENVVRTNEKGEIMLPESLKKEMMRDEFKLRSRMMCGTLPSEWPSVHVNPADFADAFSRASKADVKDEDTDPIVRIGMDALKE